MSVESKNQNHPNEGFHRKEFGTRDGYVGRHIDALPIHISNEELRAFIFKTDVDTVIRCGVQLAALDNWVRHLSMGNLPTKDQDGLVRRFSTLSEFEGYVLQIYNRLDGRKKRQIRQNIRS